MNPCRTALVGLLVVSCALVQADISHLYNAGDMATNLPSGTPFWWMNDKSPFKRAILGCSSGNCAAQSNQVAFIGNAQPQGFASQQQQQFDGFGQNPFAGSKNGVSGNLLACEELLLIVLFLIFCRESTCTCPPYAILRLWTADRTRSAFPARVVPAVSFSPRICRATTPIGYVNLIRLSQS